MVWLAKWIREHIKNSRVLIITDRMELDDQIEKVFKGVKEDIYRTKSGDDLIRSLNVNEKWLLCSLIHKFGGKEEGEEVGDVIGSCSPHKVFVGYAKIRSTGERPIAKSRPVASFWKPGEFIGASPAEQPKGHFGSGELKIRRYIPALPLSRERTAAGKLRANFKPRESGRMPSKDLIPPSLVISR